MPTKANLQLNLVQQLTPIFILIVLLLFNLLFLTGRAYNHYQTALASRDTFQAELIEKQTQVAQVDSFFNTMNNLAGIDQEKLKKIIPYREQDNLEDFMTNMHRLSQQSGVLITSIFIKEPEEELEMYFYDEDVDVNIKSSNVSITLRGDYLDFLAFLELLERNVRIIDIVNISMSVDTTTEGISRNLAITISAEIYNLAPPSEEDIAVLDLHPDLSFLDTDAFRSLQVLVTHIPTDIKFEPNPFTTR